MDTLELDRLESHIESLLTELQKLRMENNQLHQRLTHDQKMREVLSAKNHQAAEKIKKVVRQLKESIS